MSDTLSYGLRLCDVRQQIEQLPANVRDAFWGALGKLSDVKSPDPEALLAEPDRGVYRHASPPFEIYYEVDPAEHSINVSQVVVPAFKPRITVFISYCHENQKWFAEFAPFLKSLTRRNQLIVRNDKQLEPSEDFESRIREFIDEARFAVLLVTQQFLNSDFISDVELPLILEKHRQGQQEIYWLPFGYAVFEEDSPFRRIQAAFNPKSPLYELTKPQREKAYKKISERLLDRVRKATDAAT